MFLVDVSLLTGQQVQLARLHHTEGVTVGFLHFLFQSQLIMFVLDQDMFQKKVIRYLLSIENKLNSHSNTLNLLLDGRSATPNIPEDEYNGIKQILPISSEADFTVLENYLGQEKNLVSLVCLINSTLMSYVS